MPAGTVLPALRRAGRHPDGRSPDRAGYEQPPINDMARIQFGQSPVQIEGTYVPVADFNLAGGDWIYFSHHVLLWTDPTARLSNSSPGRRLEPHAGRPAPDHDGGARAGPHRALGRPRRARSSPCRCRPGQAIWVREHRFLAATGNVTYEWEPVQHLVHHRQRATTRETHYPLGHVRGPLRRRPQSPGLLLLHAPGNTFMRDLGRARRS